MTLRPFNLEEAKAGKPVVCRDGVPAKFVAHVPTIQRIDHRVLVDRNGMLLTATDEGRYRQVPAEDDFDLFMAPEKKSGWVNLYTTCVSDKQNAASFVHPSKREADESASSNRIACIEVTYTEGQGL